MSSLDNSRIGEGVESKDVFSGENLDPVEDGRRDALSEARFMDSWRAASTGGCSF